MSDARHSHDLDFIINSVDYAVIANADAPFVSSAAEFLASWRSGVCSKRLDSREDTVCYRVREPEEFFLRAGLKRNPEFRHSIYLFG